MHSNTPTDIVFIHGMWCTPAALAPLAEFFRARGYRCHLPALRFHDQTQPPAAALGTTSLLDYAADLEALIRSLPQPPVLIGHSMGGLLAQILCARGLARQAVLLAPASPAGIHALSPSVIRSFAGVMARWGFWKKPNRLSPAAARYALFNGLPAAQADAAIEAMCYESGRAAFEIGFWLLDARHASTVDAAAVTQPLLVISGAQDHITPTAVHKRIAARYAQAEYRCYAGHAHWLMAEPGWEKIAGDIAGWLEKAEER